MEELQRKVASRRGQRAQLTKLHNKMEDIMAGEIDASQRARICIHIRTTRTKALEVISIGYGHKYR